LIRQLNEVDEAVKNQLGAEAKDQDAALRRKLEARRLRRERAIEKEREYKESRIQQRIDYALVNSTDFAIKRNQMTLEAFEKIIEEMRMKLAPEEIPAAMENLIDDKHQKELSDWLLKLYEQKAIELKEEILTMLEEKIAKQ
jgi:isopropylmalate/homocitrate/citramalate synthase